MDRRNGDATSTGIQQLNSENEAARFDEALAGYFRVATAAAASGRRARGRGGRGMIAPASENDSSETAESCLKQLKRLLRDAAAPVQSQYIQRLFATVLHQLQRGSRTPIVFSRAVELCDELFKRSVVFRALITKQTASFFDRLLVAAGEDPSANVSRALRARTQGSKQLTEVLALIETWKQDFGHKYPSLVAGHAVLMERGYVFPQRRERRQEQRQREVDTIRHRERVSEAKKQQRDREMAQFVPEMEQVLVEMNRVFEILVPTLDAFDVSGGSGDEEEKSTRSSRADAAIVDEEKFRGECEGDIVADRARSKDQRDYQKDDKVQWEDANGPPAIALDAEDGSEEEEDIEWESVETDDYNDAQDGTFDNNDDTDDHMDINDIVQAYGLGSSSYQLTVEVSKQRFLPLLDDWEQHSTLTGSPSSSSATMQSQREVLLQIRDLRDRMTRALLKWDDLVQCANSSNKNKSTRPAVVALPIDAYDPPSKRQRRTSNIK
ncbi:uv-stimulated scaffold protein a isoform x2 [Phytophthora cinnamomi]|uniref:uv-stimulated scaffold protein a isoform x2 n=1 Tax=Phytophthora cinnamomi TaxID=4785 RepID=UPI00355A6ED8|nr:uv-stimulated scaffold protein a isoform x2 [Phytophthora cinnamomi]